MKHEDKFYFSHKNRVIKTSSPSKLNKENKSAVCRRL